MKRIIATTLISLLGLASFGQKVKKEKLDFDHTRVPMFPVGDPTKNETYSYSINNTGTYPLDLEEVNVELPGFKKVASGAKIEVVATFSEHQEDRTKVNAADGEFYYMVKITRSVSIKIIQDGKEVATEEVATRFYEFKTPQTNVPNWMKKYFEGKIHAGRVKNADKKVVDACIEKLNHHISSTYGYPKIMHNDALIYTIEPGKVHSYKDINKVTARLKKALVSYDATPAQSRAELEEVIVSIDALLAKSNVSDKKARINKKVFALLTMEKVYALTFAYRFEEAQELAKQVYTNSSLYDMAQDEQAKIVWDLAESMKKRYEKAKANAGTFYY